MLYQHHKNVSRNVVKMFEQMFLKMSKCLVSFWSRKHFSITFFKMSSINIVFKCFLKMFFRPNFNQTLKKKKKCCEMFINVLRPKFNQTFKNILRNVKYDI